MSQCPWCEQTPGEEDLHRWYDTQLMCWGCLKDYLKKIKG